MNQNQDPITSTLSEILNVCSCHIINPKKTKILAWVSKQDPTKLVLRIADQRFLGCPNSDKNNENYWRFHAMTDHKIEPDLKKPETPPNTEPDLITKFQHRQAQVKAYEKPNNAEPNNSSQSAEPVNN